MKKSKRLFPALGLGLGLGLTVTLLWLLGGRAYSAPVALDALKVAHDCSGVSNCYPTIQDALDAANDGKAVQVAQGVYTEPVVISKSVSLAGGWNNDFTIWNRHTFVTTIDAQRNGPAIRVQGIASPTIEGFTITGGDDSNGLGRGGGIQVTQAGAVIIRYNVITGNIACAASSCQGQGGGIGVYSATVIIADNIIISNTAHNGADGGGEGGGVYVGGVFSSYGTLRSTKLTGNHILSNTASLTATGRGGGVYAVGVESFNYNIVQGNVACRDCDGSGGGIFATQLQNAQHNTIVENEARRGGGMYLDSSSYTQTMISNNFIARNQATSATAGETNGGGGIISLAERAEFVNNEIVSNTAAYFGGGLLLVGASACQVRGNSIEGNRAVYGGGLFVRSSSGVIAHNQIISNTATARGGGLYLYANAAPLVDANLILSNTVSDGPGGGICIRNNSIPVTLTNQIVAHNSALRDGAGMHVSLGSGINLINNTLVDNDRGSGQEGVALLESSQITMTNNIIAGHSVAITVSAGSTATLSHNDYWDNTVGVSGQLSATTDMTVNPGFVGRAMGDYHLSPGSLLLEAGDGSVNVPYDFEGDPRPLDGGIEIGADEFSHRVYLPLLLALYGN